MTPADDVIARAARMLTPYAQAHSIDEAEIALLLAVAAIDPQERT